MIIDESSRGFTLYTMKVIDSVLAFDEREILNFRNRYLRAVVDRFFVFEADVSFSGRERSNFLSDYKDLEIANTEFIRIQVPDAVIKLRNPWAVEEYCRDWSMEFISRRFPRDAILFTDIDEIPSVDQVSRLPIFLRANSRGSIPMNTAYRRANWFSSRAKPDWRKPKGFLGATRIPGIRYRDCPVIPGQPGIHLRYMGYTPERVARKYENFSHQELNRDVLSSVRYLDFADKFGLNHLAQPDAPDFGRLTTVHKPEYSDVLVALSHQRPEWISQDNIQPSASDRRLAYTQLVMARLFDSLRPLEKSRGLVNRAVYRLANVAHLLTVFFGLVVAARVLGRVWASGFAPLPGQSFKQWLSGLYSVSAIPDGYVEPDELATKFYDESDWPRN